LLRAWLDGKFAVVFAAYCAGALLATEVLGWGFGNSLNPLLFIALSVLTFTAAFSANTLSDRLLRRNDVSYGVYIYHEPVINLLLALGLGALWMSIPLALALTIGVAFASWRLVEKPALSLKRHPLYQHVSASAAA
jgi:peptidoglycan/LPS O-acetylase OafA/YrhL